MIAQPLQRQQKIRSVALLVASPPVPIHSSKVVAMFNVIKTVRFEGQAKAVLKAGVLAGCLVFGTNAPAGLTFEFNYSSDPTDSFSGASNQYRRTALETAGSMFSSYFGSLFSNSGTITLGVTGSFQDCTAGCTLAYAGSGYNATIPSFGDGEIVRNKLVNGVDLNGAAEDGMVGINWGASWELDPNVSVAAQHLGNFDFYAALFHEFTHTLGFASEQQFDGSDGSGLSGVTEAGFWNKFDQFKTDCQGNDLIDHNALTTTGVYAQASVSAGGKSMCFAGANAMAANGGNAVALYAPGPFFEPGSSGSHLLSAGLDAGAMMKYDRSPDVDEARTYNAITRGVLLDIGYSALDAEATVPEPGTLALVLVALGAMTVRTPIQRARS